VTGVEAPAQTVHRADAAATVVVGRARGISGQALFGCGHNGCDPWIDDPAFWAEIVRTTAWGGYSAPAACYSPDKLVKSIASHRGLLLTLTLLTSVRMRSLDWPSIGQISYTHLEHSP
jgi:hypothetical protein